MCNRVDGQHLGTMMLHPQGMLSKEIHTFEIGIALLTCASSSMDNGVESAYWIEHACMPRPYYITLWRVHGLDSKYSQNYFSEIFKNRHLRKFGPSKFSAIRLPQTGLCNLMVSVNKWTYVKTWRSTDCGSCIKNIGLWIAECGWPAVSCRFVAWFNLQFGWHAW